MIPLHRMVNEKWNRNLKEPSTGFKQMLPGEVSLLSALPAYKIPLHASFERHISKKDGNTSAGREFHLYFQLIML